MSSKDMAPLEAPIMPTIFIQNQFRTKPVSLPRSTDLTGKVAIVTGSNQGLGFEAARQLLSFGLSHLILAVRSIGKGEEAAAKMRSANRKADIQVWRLDMSSYASIQEFAERVKTDLTRLDLAILNAGRIPLKYTEVASTGHAEPIQVNYLSTMLLAVLLLPPLKAKSPAGTPGRLTIINSLMAYESKFVNKNETPLIPSFDNKKIYDAADIYNVSKLLGQMFVSKLIEYVSPEDVIINLPCPGLVKNTGLARDLPLVARPFYKLFTSVSGRSVEVGASIYLDAAVAHGKESHGSFLMNWKVAPYAPLLYKPEGKKIAEKLWVETLEELSFADVRGIINSMQKA